MKLMSQLSISKEKVSKKVKNPLQETMSIEVSNRRRIKRILNLF